MKCRAKNPNKCRYHSALRRLAEAVQTKDVTAYLKERALVESMNQNVPSAENGRLKGETHENLLSGLNELLSKDAPDSNKTFKERTKYLEDTAAVPTPMEVYALWLSVYESQGNKIPESKIPLTEYNSFSSVISEDEELKEKRITYKSIAWNKWAPTKGEIPIPLGYGSAALEIFILPELVTQPLGATSNDNRAGWEYGHSKIYTLTQDPSSPSGYEAETNNPHRVRTFRDVEQYRKGKTFTELLEGLKVSVGKITE